MKPRNKREREVAELSSKLPPLVIEEEWAKSHIFSNEAYKCKDEYWCSNCSYTWIDTCTSDLSVTLGVADKVECPYCHEKLNVKVSKKQKNDDVEYMTVATVSGAYQVLRHVYCNKFTRKKDAFIHYYFNEVVQEWISEDGRRTIMARPMNIGGTGWLYSEPLSIKNEFGTSYYFGDGYAFDGVLYLKVKLLPILKKYGLKKNFFDCVPSRLIRGLLGKSDYELCIKTNQISMLKHMIKTSSMFIKYKQSFNICNRNNYKIKDASLWIDYIDLLSHFEKDLRNAHYVCPNNLKKAHDYYAEKRRKQIDRENREREERAMLLQRKEIEKFEKRMARFAELTISESGLTISPLMTVDQFRQEGEAMHHCVFSAGYWKRSDCLILSAKIENQRIETIEVNLKTFAIIQSRAKRNETSEHHDKIVGLVKNNINNIKKLATA
nr:PcfJ domain-containing protein [uncultured Macellibacteroides sp.]